MFMTLSASWLSPVIVALMWTLLEQKIDTGLELEQNYIHFVPYFLWAQDPSNI